MTATLLVACWLLGANATATIVAAIAGRRDRDPAAGAAVPQGAHHHAAAEASIRSSCRRCRTPNAPRWKPGTVGFEGELFSGKPDWDQLLSLPKPQLTAEEQAFLDGPCEELCRMTDDWDITHVRADLPPELWEYIKQHKFFGLNIPKEYGGLGFSALMNHKVIQKLASISTVVSSTVGVPNSLGPAELLMHYGTDEQKREYLPRLADGREVPCFALTGPFAGSDATSIPDYGIVCDGRVERRQRARRPPHARQALHHARAGRDADRRRVPHVRPRRPARRQARHRHLARAGAARHARARRSAAATSRSTRRSRTARSTARTCSCRCRS